MIVIISGEFFAEGLLSISSAEAHLGGKKLKDDPKADTAVTQYLLFTGNMKLVP